LNPREQIDSSLRFGVRLIQSGRPPNLVECTYFVKDLGKGGGSFWIGKDESVSLNAPAPNGIR